MLAGMAAQRSWSEIVGAELHPEGLEFARRRVGPDVTLRAGDACHIPEREHFDLIGAFDVLEHIEDDTRAIREIAAALVPGGGVIATVPQHRWLWSDADVRARHVRRYEPGDLESKLTGAGFGVLFSSCYTSTLLPLMALSRLRKHRGTDISAAKEFEAVQSRPFVNKLLRGVLMAETSLTLAGMRWPGGGSRRRRRPQGAGGRAGCRIADR